MLVEILMVGNHWICDQNEIIELGFWNEQWSKTLRPRIRVS